MPLARSSLPQTTSVMSAIYGRRSTRRFSSVPVTTSEVETLLGAAAQAPSNLNLQPWSFAVIQDPEVLAELSEASKAFVFADPEWPEHSQIRHTPVEDPSFNLFYGASTLLVIYLNGECKNSNEGECFMAAQNIMLLAHELGLATCPIGYAREALASEKYRTMLGIPPSHRPILSLAVGYASGPQADPGRKPPMVHSWLH